MMSTRVFVAAGRSGSPAGRAKCARFCQRKSSAKSKSPGSSMRPVAAAQPNSGGTAPGASYELSSNHCRRQFGALPADILRGSTKFTRRPERGRQPAERFHPCPIRGAQRLPRGAVAVFNGGRAGRIIAQGPGVGDGTGGDLGLYGFGAAAHIIIQVARFQGRQVFAFTREGDLSGQDEARELGAAWAGSSTELPPRPLDAAIIFAPVGALVPMALRAVKPGGSVVCGGIHMSDIPSFPYSDLWGERVLRSVANLTRRDGEEFLRLATQVPIRTEIEVFPLAQANAALDAIRTGHVRGAAVLQIGCRPAD